MKRILIALVISIASLPALAAHHIPIRYTDFDVVMDCDINLPVYVHYKAKADSGNEKRSSSFYLDKNIPSDCQQISTSSYKIPYEMYVKLNKKISYDRGHLVPANHMDGNKKSIKESNFMTNIVPMTKTVNRTGAWRETEKITECIRDTKTFDVHAGIILGNDKRDDYFLSTHGAPTPDKLWKVLFDGKNIIAWIIPNSHNALKEKLNQYKTSVNEIEKQTGLKLPIPSHMKAFTDQSEWKMPSKCDLS
jgi:endonuclease G